MTPTGDPRVRARILNAIERAFTGDAEDAEDERAESEPERAEPSAEEASGEGSGTGSSQAAPEEPIAAPERPAFDAQGGPGTPAPEGAEAETTGEHSALFSASPVERRAALSRLRARGVGRSAAGDLSRMLLEDPDPELRREAAEALLEAATDLPPTLVSRALGDPNDGVRAAAVRLAGGRGESARSELIPLVAERQWPLSQEAALNTLLALLQPPHAPHQTDVDALVDAVGRLDPLPLPSERPGFEAIARTIGYQRLAPSLHEAGPGRVGAAWLLFLEGSPSSLGAVAALAEDESVPLRDLAGRASVLLSRLTWSGERHGRGGAGFGTLSEPQREPGDRAVMVALMRALEDPVETVRVTARSALERADRNAMIAWIGGELRDGADDAAALAARVAQHLGLAETASLLLQRASHASVETRAPYLGALASFDLAPRAMVELVASVDPTHRQSAVRLVWQIGGRAVAPALPALLTDSAGPVRMATLEVIAESGDPAGVTLAEELLRTDSSAPVRATAVHLLVRAGDEARLRALALALADPDPDVRATAIEALPPGVAGSVAGSMLRAIQDADDRVWHATVRHLVALPERDSLVLWTAIRDSSRHRREQLILRIEQEDPARLERLALANTRVADRSDRALAIELAARSGTQECTAAVVAALEDPDPGIRRTAAGAMSILRTPAAVGALSRALLDPHADVRVAAVRSLGVIDDDSVPPILISALKDPEVRVRQMAVESLTGWRSPSVARRLAAALAQPDLRRSVSDVLERMGEMAVDPLVEIVMGPDPEAAAQAGSVLERIVGASTFIVGLSSVDPEERLRSVEVLGTMGGRDAAEALLAALEDPEIRVRTRSASLLGALGEERALPQLKRMVLSDPVAEVATAAEAALRMLEGRRARPPAHAAAGDEIIEEFPPT